MERTQSEQDRKTEEFVSDFVARLGLAEVAKHNKREIRAGRMVMVSWKLLYEGEPQMEGGSLIPITPGDSDEEIERLTKDVILHRFFKNLKDRENIEIVITEIERELKEG